MRLGSVIYMQKGEGQDTIKLMLENAKYQLPENEWSAIEIPYYRRSLEPSHRKVAFKELADHASLISSSELKKLKLLDDKWAKDRQRLKQQIVPWLDHIVQRIDEGLNEGEHSWKLSNAQDSSEFKVLIQKMANVNESLLRKKIKGVCFESRLYFLKLILSNSQAAFSIQERSDNFFTIKDIEANFEFEFFIHLKGSSWKRMDLPTEYLTKEKARKLILDPPWILAGSNTVRGPAINYKTMTMQEVFGLKISDFQQEGLLALWVINSSYVEAMNWLQDFGTRLNMSCTGLN